jgi:hypothetical protein
MGLSRRGKHQTMMLPSKLLIAGIFAAVAPDIPINGGILRGPINRQATAP